MILKLTLLKGFDTHIGESNCMIFVWKAWVHTECTTYLHLFPAGGCTALSWQAVHLAACLCMTQHSPVHHTILSYHLTLYFIILYCTWQPSFALHNTCSCACYLLVYHTLHVYLWLCVLPSCTCTCCMTQRLTLAQHFVLELFLICTFNWLLH